MSQVKIVAEPRLTSGKGFARKARQAGRIPAVIYGTGIAPKALEIDALTMDRFLGTAASGRLFEVQVGDKKHTVLMKDVQRDPARGTLLHVDFHEVPLDQAVQTAVPIIIVGETEREADGGVLALNMHEVQVSCLPTQIPDSVTVDVKALAMGETVAVADLVFPEGITAVDDPETAVVSIVAPRVVETTEEADEAAEETASEEAAEEAAPEEE